MRSPNFPCLPDVEIHWNFLFRKQSSFPGKFYFIRTAFISFHSTTLLVKRKCSSLPEEIIQLNIRQQLKRFDIKQSQDYAIRLTKQCTLPSSQSILIFQSIQEIGETFRFSGNQWNPSPLMILVPFHRGTYLNFIQRRRRITISLTSMKKVPRQDKYPRKENR